MTARQRQITLRTLSNISSRVNGIQPTGTAREVIAWIDLVWAEEARR